MGKVDWDSLTEHECGLRLAQIRDTAREFYGMPKKYDPGYDYEALEWRARTMSVWYDEAGPSLTEMVRAMEHEMMETAIQKRIKDLVRSGMSATRDEIHYVKPLPKPDMSYWIDEIPDGNPRPSIKFKMEGAKITKPPRR